MNGKADPGGHDALGLLRRYGTLRERLGVARASHARLPEAAQEELNELEARLVELLRLAGAGGPRQDDAGAVEGTADSAESVDRVVRRGARADPSASLPAGDEGGAVYPSGARSSFPPHAGGREGGTVAPSAAAGDSPTAIVYTDGSAEGNPGPGGFCALVRVPGRPDREISGGTAHTTNNKMELTAAIAGLRAAVDAGAREVSVVTDSEYLVKGMRDWLAGWERKGWKTATGQPVKNRELWEQLAALVKGRAVRWQWVRGHAGHPENERCDLVATTRAREAAQKGP